MDLQLAGKNILVAGSTRGIGLAIAEAFLNEGARVMITGRNKKSLNQALRQLEDTFFGDSVIGFQGDLSKRSSCAKALNAFQKRWGQIDCLVANVGQGSVKPGLQLSEKDWADTFQKNFWTSVSVIETVVPKMIKQKSGNIVTISSIVGLESLGAPITYGAAKAALMHYTKDLATQLGVHNVRVNCVAPGNILFSGGSWEKKIKKNKAKVKKYIDQEVPLKRFGKSEEVASLVAFLASDRSSFTTGSTVVCDGGQVKGI